MKKRILALVMLLSVAPFAFGAAAESPAKADAKPTDTVTKEDPKSTPKEAPSTEPRANTMWQSLFVENGRRVEIDSASIKKLNEGKVQAYGRITFDKALPDAMSGGTYQILEALNTFDCEKRTFATSRRIYRKDEKSVLRDENNQSKAELPVRSGTLDEKMLRAACRPGATDNKANFAATVNQAKAAADAHLPDSRKEHLRADLGSAKPTGEVHAAPALKKTATIKHAAPAKADKKARVEQATNETQYDQIHWAYEGRGGPENWGKLNPDNKLCDSGKRQSPIDIRDGIRVDLTPIVFNYRPSHFRIIDNGHTIQAGVSDNRINLLGKDYELIQLHFHRPSEERINGRGFDMVAHLVHRSFDGQLAVVAVMIERGNEHPLIQTLWNYLPLERHQDIFPPGVAIDLNQLLPAKRDYFTYMGSLTTPPCSEGVMWLVMQNPVQASPEQIGIFARLYPNNARPIQPPNGRLIKESR